MDILGGIKKYSGWDNLMGGVDFLTGRTQNEANAAEAAKNRAFQERMSSTAHQREVKDLRAAGLNPILSATGGSGASSPPGAQARMVSGADVGGKLMSNVAGSALKAYQARTTKATISKIEADTRSAEATAGALEARLNRIEETISAENAAHNPWQSFDKTTGNLTHDLMQQHYRGRRNSGRGVLDSASGWKEWSDWVQAQQRKVQTNSKQTFKASGRSRQQQRSR